MNNRILWIDDDYEVIQSMFFYIKKAGFKIDFAISAHDGYIKSLDWKKYDLIVVDLILPISNQQDNIPPVVQSWRSQLDNGHVGVNLVRWLVKEIKVQCPVFIFSIVPNAISEYELEDLNLAGQIQKETLSPKDLRDRIFEYLKIEQS